MARSIRDLDDRDLANKPSAASGSAAAGEPWDWDRILGYGVMAAGAIGGGILMATGVGIPAGLALAGAGLSAGGALVEGDIAADNATEQANKNQEFADAAYAIDPDDGIESLAEVQLAELKASLALDTKSVDRDTARLAAEREAAVNEANAQATQAGYQREAAQYDLEAVEGKALTTAARSGVRMAGSSTANALVQTIASAQRDVTAFDEQRTASRDLAGRRIDNAWTGSQDSLTARREDIALRGDDKLFMKTAKLNYDKASLLTQQYKDSASASRLGSYFSAGAAVLNFATSDVGSTAIGGLFDPKPATDMSMGLADMTEYKPQVFPWESGAKSFEDPDARRYRLGARF